MAHKRLVSTALAHAFLAGLWTSEGLIARAVRVLGGEAPAWLPPLVARLLAQHDHAPPDVPSLIAALSADAPFRLIPPPDSPPLAIERWVFEEPRMATPRGNIVDWPLPAIATTGELAEWLGLPVQSLMGLADPLGRELRSRPERMRNYRYHWLPKSTGDYRLVECPKHRLKQVQRRLLQGLLTHCPAHDAAHGFRPHRSVLTHVAPHVGRAVVLKMDLVDFFASVRASRVHAMFRALGYPLEVVRMLTGLTTNSVPRWVWDFAPKPRDAKAIHTRHRARQFFAGAHLPAGAPTSPSIANLCVFRLDSRLAALSRAAGASYTRYADDLVFSGDAAFAKSIFRFRDLVSKIVIDEGFEVHDGKTRVMTQGVRQRVTGVVLNAHPNLTRDDYDRLKAMVHNCVRLGPLSQNREGHPEFRAHLEGRISWLAALHPARGEKLRTVFAAIDWSSTPWHRGAQPTDEPLVVR